MEKHIRVNGLGIRVVVRPGVTGTAPLLLCGGIGMGLEALQPLVDALDPAVTVIRFDAPGAGGSPAALVPLGYPGNASLAAGLIGELGYPQADVLGLSWGGGLAQQLALQHPARVRRMILVGSGPGALGYSPGRPCCGTCSRRTGCGTRGSRPTCTAAASASTRSAPRRWAPAARSPATSTRRWPGSAGPACRGCR